MDYIQVDHIYLYDNNSNDDTDVLLKPYIESGVVSLFQIPGKKRQHDAYNDALNRFGYNTEYMCFFDLDEFLYTDGKELTSFLSNNLTGNKAGFAVNWLMFGSSGLEKAPATGVLSNFVYRSNYDCKKIII